MADPLKSAEAEKKKPDGLGSVDALIRSKEAERGREGAQVVHEAAADVQNEIAELVGGAISEKAREQKEPRDFGGQGAAAQGIQSAAAAGASSSALPEQGVMVELVVKAIRKEIDSEMTRAALLYKKLETGGAHEFTQSIARVRSLKETLSSLVDATIDIIKDLYRRYVQKGA